MRGNEQAVATKPRAEIVHNYGTHIDVGNLEPGSFIPAETLEACTGVSRDLAAFGLKSLAVKEWLISELDQRDEVFMVKGERGGLRILNNEEASDYGPRMMRLHSSGRERWYHRTRLAVKAHMLSAGTRRNYERYMARYYP